jgi:hypothetical protein
MSTSKSRQERRKALQEEYAKKIELKSGGGWGLPQEGAKSAGGQQVAVNPMMQPKKAGLNLTSLTFPSNYYQTWDLSTWRQATEQARRQGYPIQYAALTSWVFTKSSFVQYLFRELEVAIENAPFFLFDAKGNKVDDWSEEICTKSWFNQLRKEMALSWFWGFSGINFDIQSNKTYKYPQQDIDPINRYLRQSTFNLYDGTFFEDAANCMFIQPSSNYEKMLGWMEPISHAFIQINLNKNNWIQAGKKFAYPIMQVGYPESSTGIDDDGNEINPYKTEAENIARNADPSNGVVYPYTKNADGTINKSIEIDFTTGSQGNGGAYKVFKDFDDDEKQEILQLILLSTLTSQVGSKGSLALGTIHEQKYEAAINSIINWVAEEINRPENYNKIAVFYKNFPKGLRFGINKVKRYKLPEIVELSKVVTENGKRLTTDFFIDQGLSPNYLEDTPQPTFEPKPEPEAELATKPGLFGLKKKLN